MRVSSSAAVRSNAGYERTVGRTLERRVGNAPVDELGSGRERRAHLANPVAQRDHGVEPLGDELVEVLGAVRADVDSTLPQDADRVGMQRLRDGSRRSPRRSPRPTCARAAPRPSGTARCSPCTGTTPAAGDANAAVRGQAGAPAASRSAGCSAAARALERLSAGGEVDRVVAVAAVRRAATRRHQPAVAEQTQVVRHQALRLVDERHQLPHGPIALHQLSQQPPPHRVRCQPHERGGSPAMLSSTVQRYPFAEFQSIQIDVVSLRDASWAPIVSRAGTIRAQITRWDGSGQDRRSRRPGGRPEGGRLGRIWGPWSRFRAVGGRCFGPCRARRGRRAGRSWCWRRG